MFTLKNDAIFNISNWIYINYVDIFWLTCTAFFIWSIITTKSLRYKFCYFIFLTINVAICGTWLDCDLLMIMMILTEFLVILLFLLVFLSYNFFIESYITNISFFYFFYVIAIFIYLFSVPNAFGVKFSYYDFVYIFPLDVITSDLFFLYYFFFQFYPIITLLIITLLGIFSIIFICFYFITKKSQQISNFEKNNIIILRKQNLIKQSLVKNQIQTFQK